MGEDKQVESLRAGRCEAEEVRSWSCLPFFFLLKLLL